MKMVCGVAMNHWNRNVGVGLVVMFTVVHFVLCQNNTNQVAGDTSTSEGLDPIQRGLEPLYVMTNKFLDVIQPESKGNIILETVDNPNGVNLSNDWQQYVQHYIGFVICAAIGLVFFIFMPIIGLCFCCCRCCGNCGGDSKPMKTKNDKCLRVTCSTLFIVFNVMIMAGMICAFMTNELMRQQTSPEDASLIPTIVANLQSVENFKDDTITEVRVEVVDELQREITSLITRLQGLPGAARTNVSRALNAEQVLNEAKALADRTARIDTSLAAVETGRNTLTTSENDLTAKVASFKTNTANTLNGIGCASCSALVADVNSLTVTDFDTLPTVTAQKTGVSNVMNQDFPGKITVGENALNDISGEVQGQTATAVGDAESSLTDVNTQITNTVDDFEASVQDAVSLDPAIAEVQSYQDEVDQYGDYRFYAGIGIACVLLLIVLFNVLGLLFGICGEPPYEDANTCNKGVGANLLLAGVGFTFLLAWLLMLVVVLLFLLGGLLHTEACRIIVNIETSPAIQSVDSFLADRVFQNSSIQFELSGLLNGCKQDESLYKVLNLDNLVNLTDVMDISKYNVTSSVDELKNINFQITGLDIYTTDMANLLADLGQARLDDIKFSDFTSTLSKPAINSSMSSLQPDAIATVQTDLDNLAQSLTGNDRTQVDALAQESRTIVTTRDTVTQQKTNLMDETNKLKTLILGDGQSGTFIDQVKNLQTSLENTETNLKADVGNAVLSFVAAQANEVITSLTITLQGIAFSLQNEVGKCRRVYSALDSTIVAVCDSTLEPFNGYWFSVGWCLLFLIPSLICAVKLAGLYRKYEEYSPEIRSFDDPNFAAYSGDDHSSLAPQQRNTRNEYDGKHNTGYQRDDYTASRSQNYRYRYNPNSHDPGYQKYSGDHHASAPPPDPPHYHNGGGGYPNRKFEY